MILLFTVYFPKREFIGFKNAAKPIHILHNAKSTFGLTVWHDAVLALKVQWSKAYNVKSQQTQNKKGFPNQRLFTADFE